MATPLTATRLVAALKAEGCAVHEVGGWRTNNRNHKGPWGPVHGVMIHHTVTGPGTDVVELIYHGHSALPGPLATGCITKDGVVHLTGNGRANHAGGGDGDVLNAVIGESYGTYPPATHEHDGSAGAVDGNARFYGWECENKGDGKDPWPREQYLAMVKATAAVCRAHGWGHKSAIGHLEWSDWKVDPRGFGMADFRRDVADALALPAGRWEGEDPMPQYVNLGVAGEYELAPGAWDSVEFTTEWTDETGHHAIGGSVFARGPARFSGTVSLQIDGLPAGAVVQARMSEYEGDEHRADHPIHEITGTGGGSFVVLPLTKRLASGRSMRVRLLSQAAVPVTVANAVLTVLVWKEA
ncbi:MULTISPECIES: peptidoglycan recognition protein family protein [Streptomyces]|uniref:peptidoglycan recognition protein family protein n=1 Tax=Streptomyces TaxID=1883 RepID=UPI00287FAE13|nr:N-acetylmuramoyl-L-alanine amidase [Streptomyces sp. CGMCC 4.1456]WNF65601.1 N-acetylmuramoyl-L-alanine amidase [Streptomyces sp. CGMCC 4.1456]